MAGWPTTNIDDARLWLSHIDAVLHRSEPPVQVTFAGLDDDAGSAWTSGRADLARSGGAALLWECGRWPAWWVRRLRRGIGPPGAAGALSCSIEYADREVPAVGLCIGWPGVFGGMRLWSADGGDQRVLLNPEAASIGVSLAGALLSVSTLLAPDGLIWALASVGLTAIGSAATLPLASRHAAYFGMNLLVVAEFFGLGLCPLVIRARPKVQAGAAWEVLGLAAREPLPVMRPRRLLSTRATGLLSGGPASIADPVVLGELRVVAALAIRGAAELVERHPAWKSDVVLIAWVHQCALSLAWTLSVLASGEGRAVPVLRHLLLVALDRFADVAEGKWQGRLPPVDLGSLGSGLPPESLALLVQRTKA